jgi:ribosomal protein RSM22 (predicted rRNA methylase)
VRGDPPERRARAIAPPRISKGGLRLRLCATNGIVETNFPKRDRDSFRNVRHVAWGDAVSLSEDATS